LINMAKENINPNSGISGASNSVPQTREGTIKAKIIELVKRINRNPQRIEKGIPPLEYIDDGFRIIFDRYLEDFTFLEEGSALLEMVIFDMDFGGMYYWIPYTDDIPQGVTTPAMRLMSLSQKVSGA
jgi:hypothetical protein